MHRLKRKALIGCIQALGLLCVLGAAAQAASEGPRTLRGGWYPWKPYQYVEAVYDNETLTGLDIELIGTALQNAGYQADFDSVSWKQHQQDVMEGQRDFAAGAFRSKEREQFAYLSAPYRKETNVLYVSKGAGYEFENVEDMLRQFEASGFRLGVIDGYLYGPDSVRKYIVDSSNSSSIVPVPNDYVNFKNLLEGRIDGFLVDRLVGATLALEQGWHGRVEEIPMIIYEEDLHVLFSKKTCTPELVEAFNKSLAEMKESGQYNEILRAYLVPILVSITTGQNWFLIVDLIGTVAFAISGILLARKENYDLVGAFVLAALPAVGGGVVRDLLVDREPIGILRTPVYILVVFGTVVLGHALFRIADRMKEKRAGKVDQPAQPSSKSLEGRITSNIYQASDALGLAAFTIIGVAVAVESRSTPLWVWGPLLAVLTGAGGGIIRDVVRGDTMNPSLKGSFYPEIALIWGAILALFLDWQTHRLDLDEVFLATVVTLIGAFGTRILVIFLDVRSPLFGRR